MNQIQKFSVADTKAVNRAKREIEFVASRQEVDRDGDVVVAKGINTAAFIRNPVLLLEHDRRVRFGRVDSLRLHRLDGTDALVGRATILPPGVSAAADQAYEELLHGALNGISIGFMVKAWDPTPIIPGQTGKTFTATELLEISAVPIPACSSCVITGKSMDSTSVPTAKADYHLATGLSVRDTEPYVLLEDSEPYLTIVDTYDVDPRQVRHLIAQAFGERVAELTQGTLREKLDYALGRVR